jgi:BlaI family transcriptional regulator, penicillinase repressor
MSRREREIMDVLYELREAAADIRQRLADPPGFTAVRTMLRILEEKGWVAHRQQGKRYIYWPQRSPRREGQSALQRVVKVFFGGSLEQALAAHLSDPASRPTEEELQRLRDRIDDSLPAQRSKKS